VSCAAGHCRSPRLCADEEGCHEEYLERLHAVEPSVPPAVSAQDILERVAARLDDRARVIDGPAGHALTITAEELRALAQELDS
jgi:hypothetical protein